MQSRYKDLITPVEELDPFLGSNLKQKILRYIASQLNKRQNRSENLRIGRFEVRGVDDSFEKITKIHVLYTIKDDNTRILSASGYAASQRSASSKPTKYDLRTLNKHGSAPRPVRLPHTFPSLSHENRRKSRPLPLNVTPAPEVTPGASTRPAAAQRPLS